MRYFHGAAKGLLLRRAIQQYIREKKIRLEYKNNERINPHGIGRMEVKQAIRGEGNHQLNY